MPHGQVDAVAGPLFTDKDIEELHEMFSNMDIDVIKSVMYEKSGNRDASINALLSMGNDLSVVSSHAASCSSNSEAVKHSPNELRPS